VFANLERHWWILLIIVVILFGYKRLPDAARSLGRSMRILKSETKAMSEDGTPATDPNASIEATPTPAPSPAPTSAEIAAPPSPPVGQPVVAPPPPGDSNRA